MAAVGIVVYACVLLFKSGGRSWQELCYEQQTSVFVYVCGANEYTYTRPCEQYSILAGLSLLLQYHRGHSEIWSLVLDGPHEMIYGYCFFLPSFTDGVPNFRSCITLTLSPYSILLTTITFQKLKFILSCPTLIPHWVLTN